MKTAKKQSWIRKTWKNSAEIEISDSHASLAHGEAASIPPT